MTIERHRRIYRRQKLKRALLGAAMLVWAVMLVAGAWKALDWSPQAQLDDETLNREGD